jgi:hypothetical protein
VVGADARDVVVVRRRPRERLLDAQRADREVGVRRQERELEAMGREVMEGDERLEAGDAAAGDEDAMARGLRHARIVRADGFGRVRPAWGGSSAVAEPR